MLCLGHSGTQIGHERVHRLDRLIEAEAFIAQLAVEKRSAKRSTAGAAKPLIEGSRLDLIAGGIQSPIQPGWAIWNSFGQKSPRIARVNKVGDFGIRVGGFGREVEESCDGMNGLARSERDFCRQAWP